jgi:hypothetical protein
VHRLLIRTSCSVSQSSRLQREGMTAVPPEASLVPLAHLTSATLGVPAQARSLSRSARHQHLAQNQIRLHSNPPASPLNTRGTATTNGTSPSRCPGNLTVGTYDRPGHVGQTMQFSDASADDLIQITAEPYADLDVALREVASAGSAQDQPSPNPPPSKSSRPSRKNSVSILSTFREK